MMEQSLGWRQKEKIICFICYLFKTDKMAGLIDDSKTPLSSSSSAYTCTGYCQTNWYFHGGTSPPTREACIFTNRQILLNKADKTQVIYL